MHEVDHWLPSSAEVKTEWSCTSASPVELCDVIRDNITLYYTDCAIFSKRTHLCIISYDHVKHEYWRWSHSSIGGWKVIWESHAVEVMFCLYCFLVWFSMRKWLLQVAPKRTHLATVFSFLTLSSRKVRHAVCILCKTADYLVYPNDWKLLFSRMSCHLVLWNYTKVSEKLLLPSSYTDGAGSRFFLNVAILLAEYLMLHSRKQQPSVNFLKICVLFFLLHL